MATHLLAAAAGAALLASTGIAAANGLRAAVDAAWERAGLGPTLAAREAQVEARERVLDSAFPKSPTVGFAYRRDLWTNPLGKRELEPELAFPLWASGERDALRAVTGTERGALEPAAAATRLRVAGQVRESLWALAMARVELDAAQARVEAARVLEADVARRVAAGELPRADLLLAQVDLLDARSTLAQASSVHAGTVHEWRSLTGLDPAGADPEPRPAGAGQDSHPELRDRAARVTVAMAQLAQAREVRRDGPELSISTRHDRDARGLAERDTIRVGIRIPLDTEARNAPRIAAAGSALADVESEYARERLRLEAERRRADEADRAAEARRALAEERRRIAEQNLVLIDRAFRLGERPLADLLRARALRDDAALEEARSQARIGLARARLNQASGVLP